MFQSMFSWFFWLGAKHKCFPQFQSEKKLCFTPIPTMLDGATALHLTVLIFNEYLFLLLGFSNKIQARGQYDKGRGRHDNKKIISILVRVIFHNKEIRVC